MRGGAWQGPEWHGGVGQGVAGPGWARATDGGTEGSSLPAIFTDGRRSGRARIGCAWRGAVLSGEPRCGEVGSGQATADDLSTEPFGALC